MSEKWRWIAAILLCAMMMGTIAGCEGIYGGGFAAEEGFEAVDLDSVEELYKIRIIAGDIVLSGVLYDTETSRAFAEMLPLTVELWDPAPGFARAFNLREHIPRYEKSGYEYELGSLAYWYRGPSIALIYQASREESSEDAIKNSQSQTAEEGTKPSDVAEYGQQFEDDQFMEIVEKMKEAEMIVIGSPIYWHNMSGAVRNLIDRFYGPVSQGALSGRKFVFLFQGAAPEKWMMEKAEYTMSRFARMYGMEYVGMAVNNKEAEKIAKKL